MSKRKTSQKSCLFRGKLTYFKYLEIALEGVTPSDILNYDNTNFSDDPGYWGVKLVEKNINSSKGCISTMFAASAEGNILSCYVVYKAKH